MDNPYIKKKKPTPAWIKGDKMPTEGQVTRQLRALMTSKGWKVGKLHGNKFQSGWPDLYAHHPTYGARWIEMKSPRKHHYLEPTQEAWIRAWEPFGVKLYVLIGPQEYNRLFQPPNWREFVKGVMR